MIRAPTQAPVITQTRAFGARVLQVTWTSVTSTSTNPVAGYRVKAGTVNSNNVAVAFVEEINPDLTSFIFHGLSPYQYHGTPGVTYTVSVLAFNEAGDGPVSDTQAVVLPRE